MEDDILQEKYRKLNTEKDRIISSPAQEEDVSEVKIRPNSLSEFVGQKKAKDNLKVFIEAAKKREQAIDHVLLHGPPGLGKTTIAQIIAQEMGVGFRATSGPILSKAGDLAAILSSLQTNDVLFIDEIHRLNATVEEVLYPAMEDFNLDIIIGEGPAARTVRIDLQKFTLVGATTRIGLLTNPLQDRFGIPLRLRFYEIDELKNILIRAAKVLNIDINDEGAEEIAKRSRGTPRIALRLLRRIGDFAIVAGNRIIDKVAADHTLNRLEVDHRGLDSSDQRYLSYIANHYNGGPVGIDTIAAGISEQRDTIEENIEPYLMQQGFVNRTPRGRILSETAWNHLGITSPKKSPEQENLL